MLHGCLEKAVKERLISRNPTDDYIVPKLQKQEMKILHPDNISAYLKAAEKRGVLPMFFLELTCGLRKGELTALLWDDLDIEKKVLSVSKQATAVKGGGVKITRPKTETSIRRISVSDEAMELLKKNTRNTPTIHTCSPRQR